MLWGDVISDMKTRLRETESPPSTQNSVTLTDKESNGDGKRLDKRSTQKGPRSKNVLTREAVRKATRSLAGGYMSSEAKGGPAGLGLEVNSSLIDKHLSPKRRSDQMRTSGGLRNGSHVAADPKNSRDIEMAPVSGAMKAKKKGLTSPESAQTAPYAVPNLKAPSRPPAFGCGDEGCVVYDELASAVESMTLSDGPVFRTFAVSSSLPLSEFKPGSGYPSQSVGDTERVESPCTGDMRATRQHRRPRRQILSLSSVVFDEEAPLIDLRDLSPVLVDSDDSLPVVADEMAGTFAAF
ncbi:hypothetical protein DFJ73DRAFT_545988 [Zopfochytrium polystomum]|nr:hypothetical protein DFJ73DRAFT_545988 [Zopfochytrium polystomum]